jgi:hypothetical protein
MANRWPMPVAEEPVATAGSKAAGVSVGAMVAAVIVWA